MKIRQGFVSNSSSSSFVVSSNDYATVFDLAKKMLEIRDEDGGWKNTKTEKINQALREGKDPNTSIYFATGNYDTYIIRAFNHYLVMTCNNHRFDEQIDTVGCPRAIEEWLRANKYWSEEGDASWDFDEKIESWKLQCGEVFWSPAYDLELSLYDYFKDKCVLTHCKNKGHFSNIMIHAPTGKKICPICFSKERQKKIKSEPKKSRFEMLDLGENYEN